MLDCGACIDRCIRAILADAFNCRYHRVPHRPQSLSFVQLQHRHGTRRLYASQAATNKAKASQPESQSMLRRKTYEAHKTSVISEKSTSTKGLDLGISTEASPLLKKSHLAKELQFLQDPLRLAENTVSLLQRNEYDKSLEIVRLASKDISCTVSWNHLINYDMSKGDIRKAHKLYLEVDHI